MKFVYTGKSHHRDLVLWKYYLKLAIKARTLKTSGRWLRLARKAMGCEAPVTRCLGGEK